MGSCKISTLKAVRAIAFIDLIDAVIFTVYRGISLSVVLAKIPTKSDKGISNSSLRGRSNHTTTQIRDDDGHSLNAASSFMRYWSVILLTGIVITFAIEVFLFLLLNSGAPMRNLRHCKHWFILRVFLLVCTVIGSIIDLRLGEYSLISGLLEVEKLYRVVTLIMMWKFMDEIKKGDFDNSKLNFGTDLGSSNVFGSFSQAP